MRFRDREEAGGRLAHLLETWRFNQPPLVLALPRGGVPVGGAEGGGRWFSAEVDGWPEARLAPLLTRALSELEFHQRHFHEGRLGLALRDRSVILIDDGAATGATLLAAVASLRALRVEEIVVAVPVASRSAIEKLEDQADRLAVVFRPRRFRAVGDYFADFSQISEGEVLHHLGEANRSRAA